MANKRRSWLRVSIVGACGLFGAIVPFVDFLHIIEFFFLAIPILLSLAASIAYLVGRLAFKQLRDDRALFLAILPPIFVASQFVTVYTVHKVQRFRSERMAEEMEETKIIPVNKETFGIRIVRGRQDNTFVISYSRGFMVTEVYSSNSGTWKSIR
ncbi:MAG: hypothetical protein QM762_18185 [Chryseolinea sp.]